MTTLATDGYRGRVTITWPTARGQVLPAWGVEIHDSDTDESLPGVLTLRIEISALDGWGSDVIDVHLTEYCDENDEPLRGAHANPRFTVEYEAHLDRIRTASIDGPIYGEAFDQLDRDFTGERYRTVESRYLVTGMRGKALFAGPEREEC